MLRGGRVEDIDPEIRDLVRLAAHLNRGREMLTPERRAALKARILRRLDEPSPGVRLADRLAGAFALLARPAAFAPRAAAALVVVAAFAASATVAAAESLPDEPLYGWKLAVEEARLSLAQTPGERAAVELSIAEHRLKEATVLAERSRDGEADVATSAFGAHLAAAAAQLEESNENPLPSALEQLRQNLVRQQRFTTGAQHPANAQRTTPPAIAVLNELAASVGTGKSVAPDKVAEAAARAAERAAQDAARRAALPPREASRPSTATTSVTTTTSTSAARPSAEPVRPAATEPPKASPHRPDPTKSKDQAREAAAKQRAALEQQKAEQAAKAAREAAQRAREAAQKAAKNAKPSPTPPR